MKQVVFGYCPTRLDSLLATDSQQEICGTKAETRYCQLFHLGDGVLSRSAKGRHVTLLNSELGEVSGIQCVAVCGLDGTFAPWAQAGYTRTG